MTKEEYAMYLKTDGWKERRKGALKYADKRCQLCNSTDKLNVHHNTYDNLGDEMPRDLIVLCEACHYYLHILSRPIEDHDFWPVVVMNGKRWKGRI